MTSFISRVMLNMLSPSGSRARLSVLLFHKIPCRADELTPDEMCQEEFERILDVLSEDTRVLPLDDAIDALQRGNLPSRAVSLTFDDGYADWLDTVVPALQYRRMHATFFLTTEQVTSNHLWHERIVSAIRALPHSGTNLPKEYSQYSDLTDIGKRVELIHLMQNKLKYLPLSKRIEQIESLESQADKEIIYPKRFDLAAIRHIDSLGFAIGGHTIHHPILNECQDCDAEVEIGGCREELESIIKGNVKAFAYPNGRAQKDYQKKHMEMVRRCGYELAVSTNRGGASASSDCFQIPRFGPWGKSGEFQLTRHLASNLLEKEILPFYSLEANIRRVSILISDKLSGTSSTISREPLVTVITAVFNGEQFIGDTVESVINQSLRNFEYIIVNDGSSDGSAAIISLFKDERIRFINNRENRGNIYSRNIGLDMARGKYIALIDHDDIAEPDRLMKQVKVIEADSSLAIVASWAENIDAHGKKLGLRNKYYTSPEYCAASLIFRNALINSSLLIRRDSLGTIRYRAEFPLCEDYDLIVRVLSNGGVRVIPEKLIRYRIHQSNYSSQMSPRLIELAAVVKQDILSKIGVTYSMLELRLHNSIEHYFGYEEFSNFISYCEWGGKIVETNKQSCIYSNRALRAVVDRELLNIAIKMIRARSYWLKELFDSRSLGVYLRNPGGLFKALFLISKNHVLPLLKLTGSNGNKYSAL